MSEEATELVQTLVDAYQDVIGNAALGVARRHDRITIKDGTVTGFDGGIPEIDSVIDAYQDVLGDVAQRIADEKLPD